MRAPQHSHHTVIGERAKEVPSGSSGSVSPAVESLATSVYESMQIVFCLHLTVSLRLGWPVLLLVLVVLRMVLRRQVVGLAKRPGENIG